MSETAPKESNTQKIDDTDLDLVDDKLEDEGKDDETIWAEIEQEESKADPAPDDSAGAAAAAPTDDAGAEAAKVGENEDVPPQDLSDGDPSDKATPDTDDPWAGANDTQRAAFDAAQAQIKKLEQSDRSQRGRLAAAQRQINGLMKQDKPAAAPDANKAAASDNAGEAVEKSDSKGVVGSDDWKAFAKEYPEVAKPMETLVSSLTAQIESQNRQLDVIGIDRAQNLADEQEKLLAEEHDDWEKVIDAPELMPWLREQPRHIQEAAIRNGEEIVDAAEAADVLSRFKAFRSAQENTDTGNSNTETALADTGKDNGTQLSDKRQRQLESASTTRRGGPSAATGIPEDGDEKAIWKAFDKQEERQQQQRA